MEKYWHDNQPDKHTIFIDQRQLSFYLRRGLPPKCAHVLYYPVKISVASTNRSLFVCLDNERCLERKQKKEEKKKKTETRITASVLKQDPNTKRF